MKKGLALFIASVIISSFVFADELDDEIKKLEKETKLLELQKKKKDLELNKENPRSKANFKNPRLKNGIFIGIEGELGGTDTTLNISDFAVVWASSTTFDLGLMGGYQYYFGESQRHGIKVSTHIYSGFGNDWDFSITQDDEEGNINVSYIPIKFGLDVKYAWDFLERGKHTLGLNAGLGYGFDIYTNGKGIASRGGTRDFNTFLSNGIYPVLGLHYYYGHHQFELLYRGGGILASVVTKEIYKIDDYDLKQITKLTLNSQSYFTLNYAYRF